MCIHSGKLDLPGNEKPWCRGRGRMLLYKQSMFSVPGAQDWTRRRMEGFFLPELWRILSWYYFGNDCLHLFRHTSEAKVQILKYHHVGSPFKDIKGILHLSRYQEKPEKALYSEVLLPHRTTNSTKLCLIQLGLLFQKYHRLLA